MCDSRTSKKSDDNGVENRKIPKIRITNLRRLMESYQDEDDDNSSDEGTKSNRTDIPPPKMPDPVPPIKIQAQAYSSSVSSSNVSNKSKNSSRVYNGNNETIIRLPSTGTVLREPSASASNDELSVPINQRRSSSQAQVEPRSNQPESTSSYSGAAARHANLEPARTNENAVIENEISSGSINNDTSSDPEEWPLPTNCVETVDVGVNGSLSDLEMWDLECCRNEWQDQDNIQSRFHHIWTSENFRHLLDVTFKIGPQEVTLRAHRLILSVFCENEAVKKVLNTRNTSENNLVIQFPNLQPAAFWNVLQYLYTQNIEFEDTSDALCVLEVAKSLGIPELQSKCTTFLQSNIDSQHALKIFCWALELKDEHLRRTSAAIITRHIRDILSSDEFVQISEENLFDFLQNDEWFIEDELHVFTAVIRWAKHKINSTCLLQNKKPCGSDLRTAIGRSLYQIRFTSLDDSNKFLLKVLIPFTGLFTSEESLALCTYIAKKSVENMSDEGDSIPTALLNFNNIPRIKSENVGSEDNGDCQSVFATTFTTPPVEPTVATENSNSLENVEESIIITGTSSVIKEDQPILCSPPPTKKRKCVNTDNTLSSASIISHKPSSPSMKIEASKNVAETCNLVDSLIQNISFSGTGPIENNESSLSSEPPPLKRRRSTTDSTPSSPIMISHQPSLPLTQMQRKGAAKKVNSLCDYVKMLSESETSGKVKKIDKVLKIATIPQTRVYLPNLKEFNLTLESNKNRNFESGSALKSYIKPKWACLSEILFFDVKRRDEGACILSELLTANVNVSITFGGIVFLEINHEKGVVLMNFIKDAQKILNGAQNFPLKVLVVSECELYSLDEVNTEMLEVIVMRRVKGLKNNTSFLQKCRNLRSISWHDLGSEELNLTEDLLNRNPHLQKVALAKCKLNLENIEKDDNFLQELYVDNCDFLSGAINVLPKLVFVRRVQLYTTKCNPDLVLKVLQMESLEWLFVWELTYEKVRIDKKRVLTEESKKVQEFLGSIFDTEYGKKEQVTFILEKKNDLTKVSPGTSASALQKKPWDPLDPTGWKGTKLVGKNDKFHAISQLDFSNFSYDKFFSSFKKYDFFESKKQTGNNNNNNKRKETIICMDTAEVSNSSTDEAVDVVATK